MRTERVLGIDEAGRGSVLGPLVVGAFVVRSDRIAALRATGATDSKALSPAARRSVYGALGSVGERRSVALAPRTVDRYVRRGALNELEALAFARLVRTLHPDRALVDACDVDAERFGREVTRLAGGDVPVVARHHADRDEVVVGAASVVAKVRRDRAIRSLASRLGSEVGSGYPSDRRTVEFLRERLAKERSPPAYVRRSWATMQRVMPARPALTLEAFDP